MPVMGFNPRRPRGRRPVGGESIASHIEVSIHAARAGGDGQNGRIGNGYSVSIHAARAGGDDLLC